ncbi:MAG: hypothetical protein LUO93_08530 [Methanomicrobiales archaeon]|nr:hypothetical protein [Methanomicrobiales archaeon]
MCISIALCIPSAEATERRRLCNGHSRNGAPPRSSPGTTTATNGLFIDRLPYFGNGIGGASLYQFGDPVREASFRYEGGYGATLVTADNSSITFQL